MKAITCVPVSPLRAENSHRSEMVSQVLWGETVTILESFAEGWVKLKTEFDDYEGFAQQSHFQILPENIDLPVMSYTGAWVNDVLYMGEKMRVPFGCPLPGLEQTEGHWGPVQVEFGGEHWYPSRARRTAREIQELSAVFLNTPYLWGGRSVFGVDCSGFSQMIYKLIGIRLPRDAYQQAAFGEVIGFLPEVRCGDLAFFDNAEGRITHVGILLNEREIIHASGKVRIDLIDHEGILRADTGERTHHLRLMKRYF